MILVLLVITAIVWASLQGRESRAIVWRARRERVAPIARHVRADARVTREYLRHAPAWHPIRYAKATHDRKAFRQIRDNF